MLLGICSPPVHPILAIMCVHSEHAQQMERQHEAHISDRQAGLRKETHTDYTHHSSMPSVYSSAPPVKE